MSKAPVLCDFPSFRVTALAAGLMTAGPVAAVPYTIAGVDFDSDNATTTAIITGGGYNTPHGTALPSGTSPQWSVPPSLGTYFQVPTFQANYDPSNPVMGVPGTAVTLGQEPRFPLRPPPDERDIILLTWGGQGLGNVSGDPDLAVFEAATSEAFAIRAHSLAGSGDADDYWTDWFYTPYESPYDVINDATATLVDLSGFGLSDGEVINALEITNLLPADTLDLLIDDQDDYGQVFFGGSPVPGQDFAPRRYSGSLGTWVEFEAGKYDPDIQYVAGLRALQGGSGHISAVALGGEPLAPRRVPPATVPALGVPALLVGGLVLMSAVRRRGSRSYAPGGGDGGDSAASRPAGAGACGSRGLEWRPGSLDRPRS
jgi:hypothetical protein